MPVGQAQMPLFDHLGELRRRVTIAVVFLLISTCVLYVFSEQLVLFLISPIGEYLVESGTSIETLEDLGGILYALTPLAPFTLRFKVSLVFSILVTSPIWIWQFLGFFLPALKPNEIKWVVPTFFAAILLFAMGMVFCYLVILDAAFGWMTDQANGWITILPDASDYINTILLFEVGFGIAFELPLVVFYLTVFNIVPYKKLRESWRTVYVALMIVCATVTPDASPVTMLLMFSAMIALYEISLLFSRIVLARRLANEKRTNAS